MDRMNGAEETDDDVKVYCYSRLAKLLHHCEVRDMLKHPFALSNLDTPESWNCFRFA